MPAQRAGQSSIDDLERDVTSSLDEDVRGPSLEDDVRAAGPSLQMPAPMRMAVSHAPTDVLSKPSAWPSTDASGSPAAAAPSRDTPPSKPSLWESLKTTAAGRFVSGAWQPVQGFLDTANTLGTEAAKKIEAGGVTAAPAAIGGLVTGAARSLISGPLQAGVQAVQGQPGQAIGTAANQVLPVSDIASRAKSGDWAGAAGEALTSAGMLVGPHLAKRFRLTPKRAAEVSTPESISTRPSEPAATPRATTSDVTQASAPSALENEQRAAPDRPSSVSEPLTGSVSLEDDVRAAEPAPVQRPPEPTTQPPPAVRTVADLSDDHVRQLRRIVHELDAMPYTPRLLRESGTGSTLEHVEGTGGAGAAVYDDVLQAPSSPLGEPTASGRAKRPISRGVLQQQLEAFLSGEGKVTPYVQSAIEIAQLRAEGKSRIPGDGRLSTPELPPNAGDVPTRLESRAEPTPEPAPEAPKGEADAFGELSDFFGRQRDRERDLTVPEFAEALSKEGEKPIAEAPFSLTPEASQRGSVQPDLTLYSTVVPGLQEFVERDLAPVARGAVDTGREVQAGIAPQTMSANALRAADIVRQANAVVANQAATEAARSRDLSKFFAGKSDAANIANISQYERSGQFADEPAGYSQKYQQDMLQARDVLKRAYGDVGLVENYVRRAFDFRSTADADRATSSLTNVQRSLSGNRSPTRGRVLGDMTLDEALADMQARGIRVTPKTTNPEALRQWSLSNATRAIEYAKAWTQLQSDGLISLVKTGARIPDGFVPLEDRVAKVFRRTDEGLVQGGQYYASADVARVLNNAISTGFLESSTPARAARGTSNFLNRLQLASAFHGTGTAIRAAASDAALGVRQLVRGLRTGDLGTAGEGAARLAASPTAVVRQAWIGRKIINDLRSDNPSPGAQQFLEQLNEGGGRLGLDDRYQQQWWDRLKTEWANRNLPGVAWRAGPALLEKLSAPLMEWGIPRVKVGLFKELASDIDARMPNAAPADLQRAYAKAWDSIDNRLGQLVYDNLFWNKTLRDIAFVTQRAPGWNLGTMREFGGAALDLKNLAKGEVSDRLLYVPVYTAYAMMLGALTQRTMAGTLPQDWKDYFYPLSGRTDPRTGRQQRVSLPIDLKDVYSYVSDPLGTMGKKESPILSAANELRTNEDFGGVMVHNPADPWQTQAQQFVSWLTKQPRPFWLQQSAPTLGENVQRFMGLMPASAAMERSPAETLLHQYQGPQPVRTPEQAEQSQARGDLRQAFRDDPAKAKELAQSGQFGRPQITAAAKGATMTGLQAGFQRLSLDQAIDVFNVASQTEAIALLPLMVKKAASLEYAAPADQPRLAAQLKALAPRFKELATLAAQQKPPYRLQPAGSPEARR